MSRRRAALPVPPRSSLLHTTSTTPPWQQQGTLGSSCPYHLSDSEDDSPSSSKRGKATASTRCCTHCGLPRKNHSVSGCPNVWPPVPPKWFEKIWDHLVIPAIKRTDRLTRSLERLNALRRDRPDATVYIMLIPARNLSLEMDAARSLKYAVRCLYPGDSWPDERSGLLIIGRNGDQVKSVRADLLLHVVNPDSWEDLVVKALKMTHEVFWGVTTAWRDG